MERYARQIALPEVGKEGQARLAKAKVLVIGAGGLGCPALQYLAGAGVGHIAIADFDTVEVSNLHRQVLYGMDDVGEHKAIAAKRRLQALNPEVLLTAYTEGFTPQNALELLADCDVAIDASDNMPTRYLVSDACVLANKPFVYGGIYKFEGQVAVFNHQGGATYRCLFPQAGSVPSCSEAGVLGILPGIIGTMQATEALKLLLGIGSPLSNQLLVYHALRHDLSKWPIAKDENGIRRIRSQRGLCPADYPIACAMPDEIGPQQLPWHGIAVDIREMHELPACPIEALRIPFSTFEESWHTLPQDSPLLLICQSGQRSRRAVAFLRERGLAQVKGLKGGILGLKGN